MSRSAGSKPEPSDGGPLDAFLRPTNDLPIDPEFASPGEPVMSEGEFLAKGRKAMIEDGLDSIHGAQTYTKADGPDVSAHLVIAEDALRDALALIKEHQS